jgi:AcrR family transcriptional regulator
MRQGPGIWAMQDPAQTLNQQTSFAPDSSRKQQILAVATHVFAEFGFRNTDVEDIAKRLAIGKGTIYRQFPTKQELFYGCVDEAMRVLQVFLTERTARTNDPIERIKEGIRAILQFFDEHPQLIELLIQERSEFRDRQRPTYHEHKEKTVEAWQRLLTVAMQQGSIRSMPVERITGLISNLLYGTVFNHYFCGRGEPLGSYAEPWIDILLNGIEPKGNH